MQMLKVLLVFNDPFGEECKRLVEDASIDKPKIIAQPTIVHAPPLPPGLHPDDHLKHVKPDFHSELDYIGSDSVDAHFNRDKDFDRLLASSHSRDRYEDDHRDRERYRSHDRDRDRDIYRDRDRDRDRHRKHGKRDRSRDSREHYYHKADRERDRSRDRDHRGRHRDSHKKDRHDKYREGSYKKDRDYDKPYGNSHGESAFGGRIYDQSYNYPPVPTNAYPSYHNYPPAPPLPTVAPQINSLWHPLPWQTASSVPQPPPPPLPANDDGLENWDDDTDDPPPPPPPPPLPDSPNKSRKHKDKKKIEEDDQATIDLDTRIAMMFKEKSFGAAPPFLQMDDSDTDADGKPEDGEIPTKTNNNKKHAPRNSSPKTKPTKSVRRKSSADDDYASDISSSDDEILHQNEAEEDVNCKSDDKMSLSSLSSNDEKTSFKSSQLFAPQHNYLYPPGTQPYYYQDPGIHGGYATNVYGISAYMPQSYIPGVPPLFVPGTNTVVGQANVGRKTVPQRVDPYSDMIRVVIERVTNELKQILKKDFNKKMIENTAYKKFESWWDDMAKSKDGGSTATPNTEANVAQKAADLTKKAPDINQLLNSNRDNFDSYGGMRLGLRAQIPKLPSFRRIRKQPSPKKPTPQEQGESRSSKNRVPISNSNEDSQKGFSSDQEEMVLGSDTEHDEPKEAPVLAATETKVSFERQQQLDLKLRAGSTSTISSSSSEDTSSSDSDSDTSSVSDDDDEGDETASQTDKVVETAVKVEPELPPPLPKEQRVYSDTESDTEVKSKFKLPPKKIGIYSDSSSDEEGEVKKPKPPKAATKQTPPPPPTSTVCSLSGKPNSKTSTTSMSDDYSQSPKPPRTPGREDSPAPTATTTPIKKPTAYEYDRIYSDSEEEREYQDKRRRNTEYMEEIEREIREERLRDLESNQKPQQQIAQTPSTPVQSLPLHLDYTHTPSPGEPLTPSLSQIPPTPGAKIAILNNDPISIFMDKKKIKSPAKKTKAASPRKSIDTKPDIKPQIDQNGTAKLLVPSEPITAMPTPTPVVFEDPTRPIKLSPSTSSDGGSSQESQASQVAMEHCYSLPPSASPYFSSPTQQPNATYDQTNNHVLKKPDMLSHDHGYTSSASSVPSTKTVAGSRNKKETKRALQKEATAAAAAAAEFQRIAALKRAAAPFVPQEMFAERDMREEMILLYEFLTKGIDSEDIEYLKQSYEYLLQDDANSYWLNATHWMDHCVTDRSLIPPPPSKRRKREEECKRHASGSARTEGFYKVDVREKAKFKYHHAKLSAGETAAGVAEMAATQSKLVSKLQGASREARSNQRRLLTAFGASTESELLKFNQLKFRKKQLKFAKSAIHDWGLFAMEPIAADEMVIEYVGQMIRPVVADLRETKYEAIGIGSSYLFRIDLETIIDATKCGNLARFINHSCNVSETISLLNVYELLTILFCTIYSPTAMQKLSQSSLKRRSSSTPSNRSALTRKSPTTTSSRWRTRKSPACVELKDVGVHLTRHVHHLTPAVTHLPILAFRFFGIFYFVECVCVCVVFRLQTYIYI